MKTALVVTIILTLPLVLVLFFLGADIVSNIRRRRRNSRWKKARKNARWEVVTNPTGNKVVVGIGRVARVKDQEELFDTSVVGTAYLDDPGGHMYLLDLQGKAHERVMTLNSL